MGGQQFSSINESSLGYVEKAETGEYEVWLTVIKCGRVTRRVCIVFLRYGVEGNPKKTVCDEGADDGKGVRQLFVKGWCARYKSPLRVRGIDSSETEVRCGCIILRLDAKGVSLWGRQ